jgi:hypothetical protein
MTSQGSRKGPVVNRTQALVTAFFLGVLVSLLAIRVMAPNVYDETLGPPSADRRLRITFVAALLALIAFIEIGVLRRWRWMFWLLMLAFLSGVLRVPIVLLQLTKVLAAGTPAWYLLFQGLIGLIQCGIGLAMVAGYRRAGTWGAF